jgi:hypothetical protein
LDNRTHAEGTLHADHKPRRTETSKPEIEVMMENKIDIGGEVVRDLRQPNLTAEQRTFLRQHQLYHEAYAVARQINSNGEKQ